MYCGFTELKPEVQENIRKEFPCDPNTGPQYTDYLYWLTDRGNVLFRRLITDF